MQVGQYLALKLQEMVLQPKPFAKQLPLVCFIYYSHLSKWQAFFVQFSHVKLALQPVLLLLWWHDYKRESLW